MNCDALDRPGTRGFRRVQREGDARTRTKTPHHLTCNTHTLPAAMIEVTAGPNRGESCELINLPLAIGRGDRVQLRLEDERVSTKHLQIRFDYTLRCFKVKDTGSTNGTFLRHKKLNSEERLIDGDELLIGNSRLRFYYV